MTLRPRWNTNRKMWEVVDGFAVVASFDRLHQATAWVAAEERREATEAAS